MEAPYSKSVEEVLEFYGVDPEKGLDEEEVVKRQLAHGPNELPRPPVTPLWRRILAQFNDQLVQILLAAAVISFVLALLEREASLESFVEPMVILAILLANATVGVIQEGSAERAIEALKSYAADEATVIREGQVKRIGARDLVPGDLVEVAVGDRVPADVRLIKVLSSSLRLNQSLLTGESESVEKGCAAVTQTAAVKQEQVNLLFSGTMVVQGRARGIVVGIGLNTAIGAIQSGLKSDEEDEVKTPLQQRLDEFGDQLARIIGVICVLVWLVNIRLWFHPLHGTWWRGALYYFKIAVALAVAAIPEGLAVIITTCLALGTRRMAKAKAIVRTLPSVETLGCTTCICSDKTGTLTTNQMSVCCVINADGLETAVSGTTYDPRDGKLSDPGVLTVELAQVAALCNDARLAAADGIMGEPTEAALLTLVEKARSGWLEELQTKHRRIHTIDFDRTRKRMSVIVEAGDTKLLLCKGAPESVLAQCHKNVPNLEERISQLTSNALRVLAFAYKTVDVDVEVSVALECDMTFAGLIAMR